MTHVRTGSVFLGSIALLGALAGSLPGIGAARPGEVALRITDCNANGIPDDLDIAGGTSADCQPNGLPDECEAVGTEAAKLAASDGSFGDQFGNAVSMDGGVVVAGAMFNDGSGVNSGSAYVYRYDGVSWVEEARLTASDGAGNDQFGVSVSISGDLVLVGAHFDSDAGSHSGSAYVFRYDGVSWVEEAKLTASDAAPGDVFGRRVSASGEVAVVTARGDDDLGPDSGSTYVYRYDGANWVQEAKLTGSDGAAGDRFGTSVSLRGDVVVIGADSDGDHGALSGSAYVFRYDPAQLWVEEAKLTAADGAAGDRFGISASVSGEVAVVGAYFDADLGARSGSAYVFRRGTIGWVQEAKLTASDGAAEDLFGMALGVSGDIAVVGAEAHDGIGPDSGAAYVFRYHPGGTPGWPEAAKWTASDAAAIDEFGGAVSINGNRAVIGAHFDNTADIDSGSAYVFVFSDDCNANGTPDECDIAGGTSADCNGNGVPDECDIAGGTSQDINGDGVPDECGFEDCNSNGIPDDQDIAGGISADCDENGVPDECQWVSDDCPFQLGDVNNNGELDREDVFHFILVLLGFEQCGCSVPTADMNGDAVVDHADIDPFIAVVRCNLDGDDDDDGDDDHDHDRSPHHGDPVRELLSLARDMDVELNLRKRLRDDHDRALTVPTTPTVPGAPNGPPARRGGAIVR